MRSKWGTRVLLGLLLAMHCLNAPAVSADEVSPGRCRWYLVAVVTYYNEAENIYMEMLYYEYRCEDGLIAAKDVVNRNSSIAA